MAPRLEPQNSPNQLIFGRIGTTLGLKSGRCAVTWQGPSQGSSLGLPLLADDHLIGKTPGLESWDCPNLSPDDKGLFLPVDNQLMRTTPWLKPEVVPITHVQLKVQWAFCIITLQLTSCFIVLLIP